MHFNARRYDSAAHALALCLSVRTLPMTVSDPTTRNHPYFTFLWNGWN